MNFRAISGALNRRNRTAALLAALAGLATNAFIFVPLLHYNPSNDFLGLYPGGKLAGSASIYHAGSTFAVQQEAVHFTNSALLFIRPPFYAVLLWPLTQLPFFPAYCVYQALMVAAVAGFVCLWWVPDRRTALLACCWSMPLFCGFVVGQDVPVLLLVIGATLWLLLRQRDFQAGLVFSLCAIKPHLFLLFPLFILGRQAWRFGSGLALGGSLLVALSFAGGGRHWLSAFLRASTLPQVSPSVRIMPNLNGMFHGSLRLELLGIVAVSLVVWFAVRRGSLQWAFAATLAGGLLTSHHAYVPDCVILIPALLIMRSQTEKNWQRFGAFILLTPLPYIGFLSGGAASISGIVLLAWILSFASTSAPVRQLSLTRLNLRTRSA